MSFRFLSATFVIALAAAAFAPNAHAADKPTSVQLVAFFFRSSGQLSLTEAQRHDIDMIVKATDEQTRQKGADIETIRGDEMTKIEAVLTKEQLDKLKKLIAAATQPAR